MANEVVFKLFRTYAHPYVYDRHTNTIIRLTEDEFSELQNIENRKIIADDSLVVRNHQEYGNLMPNAVKRIEHPFTTIIEHSTNKRMRQLTLQVTQQCNLRCTYCQFSGNYYDNYRTHENNRMSWETAKNAIDFFLERSVETKSVVVSFYGGEPLLEFELIKRCVAYVHSKTEGQRVEFLMTTNGTCFTDSIVDFLKENNFGISVSIDGSRENHNLARKFASGEGSFDVIVQNIKKIRNKYPSYGSRISIMATVSPEINLSETMEYFEKDDTFEGLHITYNAINPVSLSRDLIYDENYNRIYYYEHMKMLFNLIGALDADCVSPLVEMTKLEIQRRYRSMNGAAIPAAIHSAGTCMLGVNRLFVNVDGVLYPCERINENVKFFRIGSLTTGLDINHMQKMLNTGKLTVDRCSDCWNLRQCSFCISELELTFDAEPTASDLVLKCEPGYAKTLVNMHEIAVLQEYGFDSNESEGY